VDDAACVERMMSSRYRNSEEQLERARKTIPLGAQTFSKSVTQYPLGVSPYFAERGKGSRLWDVDGNEYIDFINALASVTLGYCDPDVEAAVREQLGKGTIFSLSHRLESEVAEMICQLVPSAEMARFGKNGSDATAGAIRVARAFTGRDHVLACGYHGWQDWYIGATPRNKGVPKATSDLTHVVPYNDISALERQFDALPGQVAAVIMEPMNTQTPKPGYLEAVRELTERAGTVLVFDETITGFRFATGGAQELFGITPDLTTLGKGVANGYPLSVVCGRRDLMMEMEEVFFSFTMGGETLSLAAALATMKKVVAEPVIATMRERGERVLAGVNERLMRHDADFLSLSGHPSWSFLNFTDAPGATSWEIKTLWLQELFERGILSLGNHVMSYAHTNEDVDRLLEVYDEVLPFVVTAVRNGAVRQYLRCDPLVPLFRLR
jgi:glutamate-1-semialdehyde 2,1-aminomutase